MRKEQRGFSLIEILLVLALVGLISSVCVVHFDSLTNLFSKAKTHPLLVLDEALKEARLWSSQHHRTSYLCPSKEGLALKDSQDQCIKNFFWSDAKQDLLEDFCKLYRGKLTEEGLFVPDLESEEKRGIRISADGFFRSTFVEFNLAEGKEHYQIDVLTGECKEISWD